MTAEDVIAGFFDDSKNTLPVRMYADELYQEALRICMEINTRYHEPAELRKIMSRLIGKDVDESFRLFPPFYTDFGKNISIGKNVFINSGCHFQDQGGIEIGDGALIGHNVVFATINHSLDPSENRKNYYAPIKLERNVWVGSNSTILSGVTVGEWSVIGAGSVENDENDENAETSDQTLPESSAGSTLIAYLSATGTTEQVAEYIGNILNADIYEIVPQVPYTDEDLEYYTGGRADLEQDDPSARPAIEGGVENMDQYDTIFLGYPIWHGQDKCA